MDLSDTCPNCGRPEPLRVDGDDPRLGVYQYPDGRRYYAEGQCPGCDVWLVSQELLDDREEWSR